MRRWHARPAGAWPSTSAETPRTALRESGARCPRCAWRASRVPRRSRRTGSWGASGALWARAAPTTAISAPTSLSPCTTLSRGATVHRWWCANPKNERKEGGTVADGLIRHEAEHAPTVSSSSHRLRIALWALGIGIFIFRCARSLVDFPGFQLTAALHALSWLLCRFRRANAVQTSGRSSSAYV